MSDIVTSESLAPVAHRGGIPQLWTKSYAWLRSLAAHPDPLVEANNWVALTIGSHLPFWPLYVTGIAGSEAWPSALLTIALTPFFLAIPLIARRSGFASRIAMPVFGIVNTIFTMWVLGINSGTEVFLVPCAALAAIVFRRSERWLMLCLTMAPLLIWWALQTWPLPVLQEFTGTVARDLKVMNVFSVALLIVAFGWFQVGIYGKMEDAAAR